MVIADVRKSRELNKVDNKKLLVDIDGVICKYDFPALVKEYFNVEIDARDIYAYNLSDVLGVSSKEIDDMFKEQVWGAPEFIEDALGILRGLSKIYEIIIYSNRVKYMGEMGLAKWLIDCGIPFRGIDNGQGEYYCHIDDRPQKLEDTNSKIKLLFSQPWNEGCRNIKGNLKRVYSWPAIRKELL